MAKVSDTDCRLCGQSAIQASKRGAYLKRVNEKGVPGIWECSPTCDRNHGTPNDALMNAIECK